MKRKIMAVLLSAALVMSSTVVAFAEDVDSLSVGADETVKVEGNVTRDGVQAGAGSTVEVTGNVEGTGSEYGMGIMAGPEATVTVGGDVTANSNAIEIEGDNADIRVAGDVTSNNGEAVAAGGGSLVVIGGDANASENSVALQVYSGGNSGDTTEVVVKGATSGKIGAEMHTYGEGDLVVVVEDTLTGTDKAVVYSGDTSREHVLAYKVEGDVVLRGEEGEESDASNLINYILKKTSEFIEYVSGITQFTVNETDYDTAKADVPVVIRTASGYAANCEGATLTKNADGTYTLTVPQGGGVTLTAEQIQEAVQEAEQQPEQPAAQPEQPAAQPEQPAAQPEQPAAQPEQPAAQPEQPAAPVGEDKKEEEHQSSSSAQDQNTLLPTAGTVVLAGYDEATALDPAGDPAAYVSAFVDKIANTPQGGTAELFVTDAAYLDDTIVQALVARSDVAVKLNVTVNGQALVINIPAGYNLSRLIGKGGKISMKKLIELFVQKK